MRELKLSGMRVGAMILGTCVVLGACAKKDDAAVDSTTTTAAGSTTTDTAAGSMANTNAMSDQNILASIAAANESEIAAGKVAQTKATNAEVKSFASTMVQDHTAMQKDGDQLATRLNIKTEGSAEADQMKQEHKAALDSLNNTAKGASFDKMYIANQVAGHQAVLDHLQKAQGQAQSADIKTMIQQAIPKVQQHLDRARQIQSKLGS
jgi:putative membrane protein